LKVLDDNASRKKGSNAEKRQNSLVVKGKIGSDDRPRLPG
jgi:hypothetical protein